MLIYLITVIIYKIIKKQADQRLKVCMAALAFVVIATIVDIASYYKTRNNSGIWGRLSFLVFIIILGLESGKTGCRQLEKRAQDRGTRTICTE